MREKQLFVPFLDRDPIQESGGSSIKRLPTIADWKETQRYHNEGNKNENRNKAQPNEMHVVHMYL
jgi:hypothetical protein